MTSQIKSRNSIFCQVTTGPVYAIPTAYYSTQIRYSIEAFTIEEVLSQNFGFDYAMDYPIHDSNSQLSELKLE